MSGVPERLAKAAEARAGALRERVVRRIARLLPGVAIRTEGDRIDLSGANLIRRWTQTDALRDWREGEP